MPFCCHACCASSLALRAVRGRIHREMNTSKRTRRRCCLSLVGWLTLVAVGIWGSGCASTPVPDALWLGVPYVQATWRAVDAAPNPPETLGYLQHREWPTCRVTLMGLDPIYAAGSPDRWTTTSEMRETELLKVQIRTARDPEGAVVLRYFDVYDRTGSRGHELFRLGYYAIEAATRPDRCADAFYDLLIQMDPQDVPDLPVAQG